MLLVTSLYNVSLLSFSTATTPLLLPVLSHPSHVLPSFHFFVTTRTKSPVTLSSPCPCPCPFTFIFAISSPLLMILSLLSWYKSNHISNCVLDPFSLSFCFCFLLFSQRRSSPIVFFIFFCPILFPPPPFSTLYVYLLS